jgi:hypothetical protein
MPPAADHLNPHITIDFADAAFATDQNVKGVTHLESRWSTASGC